MRGRWRAKEKNIFLKERIPESTERRGKQRERGRKSEEGEIFLELEEAGGRKIQGFWRKRRGSGEVFQERGREISRGVSKKIELGEIAAERILGKRGRREFEKKNRGKPCCGLPGKALLSLICPCFLMFCFPLVDLGMLFIVCCGHQGPQSCVG